MTETNSLNSEVLSENESAILERFAFRRDPSNGRVVLYVSTKIHGDEDPHATGENEVMFYESESDGIVARACDASEMMLDAVDVISSFAWNSFHQYFGIRLSSSDNIDYASKVVFRLPMTVDVEDICRALVQVIHYKKHASYEIERLPMDATLSYSEGMARDRYDHEQEAKDKQSYTEKYLSS